MPFFERRLSLGMLFKMNWPVYGCWLADFYNEETSEFPEVLLRKIPATDTNITAKRWCIDASPTGDPAEPSTFTFEILGVLVKINNDINRQEIRWPPAAAYSRHTAECITAEQLLRACSCAMPLPSNATSLNALPRNQFPQKADSPRLAALFIDDNDEVNAALLLHESCMLCSTPYGDRSRKFWVPAFQKWTCFECLVTSRYVPSKPLGAECLVNACKGRDVSIWFPQAVERQTASTPFFLCRSHKQAVKNFLANLGNSSHKRQTTGKPGKLSMANMATQPFMRILYARWVVGGQPSPLSDRLAVSMIKKYHLWFVSAATCAFFHAVCLGKHAKFADVTAPWDDPHFFQHVRTLFPNPTTRQTTGGSGSAMHIVIEQMQNMCSDMLQTIDMRDPYSIDREEQLRAERDALREQLDISESNSTRLENRLKSARKIAKNARKAEAAFEDVHAKLQARNYAYQKLQTEHAKLQQTKRADPKQTKRKGAMTVITPPAKLSRHSTEESRASSAAHIPVPASTSLELLRMTTG